jgi:nucleoside phosphorylase
VDKHRLLAVIEESVTQQRERFELTSLRRISEFASRQQAPYRIGLITALPKEAAAVRAVFADGIILPSAARSAVEFREVSCPCLSAPGQGHHQIVLCQSVRMGNNSAAVAATALLSDYPNIEDIVMVGIAGGMPNIKAAKERAYNVTDHIRKGDIVVGEQVIQYDFFKLEEDRSENRSKTPQPSARLLSAVNRLDQEMSLGQRPWEEFISSVGATRGWGWPRNDLLFDYSDDPPIRLKHPKTHHRPGIPSIHRGVIASANILLKNHSLREELRQKHKIKAIEMEASGIADAAWNFATGYLVIRGVCDYCDPSKDDVWQAFAALAAAAYARAVIERIPL